MSALVRVRNLKLSSAPGADLLRALRLESGIDDVETTGASALKIRYRLPEITLNQLVRWLSEHGAVVDASALNRIWLAVYGYMDTVQSDAACSDSSWDADLRRVYISRQLNRQHGHRDERARHWRKYLTRDERAQ